MNVQQLLDTKMRMDSSWPDWLNETLISKALGESKIITKVSINPAVSKGEHFLSTILRAKIEYKNEKHENPSEKTSVIIKSFPGGYLKDFIHDNGILMKEFKMYTTVLPQMSKILGKYITPTYFECGENDVLILEDLTRDNFKNGSRIDGLDLEHCISAMNTLADFHGASYIMNQNNPELLECVKKEVQYTEENAFQKQFINNCFKIVAEEIKTWPDFHEYSGKLLNIRERIWNETVKEISPNDYEIMVLNHGDFWTNNILFRYDKSHKIAEVKLIDFQFCRWSSPAVDLHIFFTISVLNKEYKDKLIDAYLTCLNKIIQPQCMTKSQLLNALHRTECISLMISVCVLPAMLLNPSKVIDITEIDPKVAIEGVNNNPLCRIACKDEKYKKIFPEYLKYFENIGLL